MRLLLHDFMTYVVECEFEIEPDVVSSRSDDHGIAVQMRSIFELPGAWQSGVDIISFVGFYQYDNTTHLA